MNIYIYIYRESREKNILFTHTYIYILTHILLYIYSCINIYMSIIINLYLCTVDLLEN